MTTETRMSDTNALQAMIERGEGDRAERAALALMEREPQNANAWRVAGGVALHRGDFEQASKRLTRALSLDSRQIEAWNDLGRLYLALHQPEQAVQAYRRALTLDGQSVAALLGVSAAFDNLGRTDDAIISLRAALDAGADEARTRRHIASVALAARDLRTADAEIAAATALAPRDPDTAFVLGNVRSAQQRHADAAEAFALAAHGADRAEALFNRAMALDELGRWQEAAAACAETVALAPHLTEALAQLVYLRRRLCDWTDIGALSTRLRDAVREGRPGVTPFSFLAEPAEPAEQLACARLQANQTMLNTEAARRRSTLNPRGMSGGAPRVGFISSGFNNHPTALLIVRLVESLREIGALTTVGFATTPDDGGALRVRLRDAFHEFEDVAGLGPEALAGRIYDRRIDVLLDLRGYGAGGVSEALALRPAPVQVNWLAYPGTSGAPFIDYLLADTFVVPDPHRAHYSEALVRMPHAFQPSDTSRAIGEPPPRAALGLPEDGVVFASFNNSYKIAPDTFATWMRILRDVPGSVLWLLEGRDQAPLAANLRAAAAAHGVDGARLVFQPKLAHDAYLALYKHVDLFLDTWPYNAHTTASDALWAGVPLLTLPGETFASRVAGSLLTTLGLPELIARSADGYAERAIALAKTPDSLARWRERVARARQQSPLFDMRAFALAFERSILHMVQRARRNLPPADADIAAE
jgi:predicted O-linked N-acetylglucosamine transferase (SPINDLY family)